MKNKEDNRDVKLGFFGVILLLIASMILIIYCGPSINDFANSNVELFSNSFFFGVFITDGSSYLNESCLAENHTMEDGLCAQGDNSSKYVYDIRCNKNIGVRLYYGDELISLEFPDKTKRSIERNCAEIKYINPNYNDSADNSTFTQSGGKNGI